MIDKSVKLSELEVGPHFITVYGTPRSSMFSLARNFYKDLRRSRKDIFKFQQKDLAHEPNDPNVYHPYGQPDQLGKKHITHFHVRFPGGPLTEDLNYIIDTLKKFVSFPGDIVMSEVSDYDKEGIGYPTQGDMDYFDYIEFLRKGEWKCPR
jgi:hypothetical protein